MAEKGPFVYSNPGPLGLSGFAMATFVLNVHNAGLLPAAFQAVLPLGLLYGGLAQFIAGYEEMKTGNTFGMTAFASYGAFWMALVFLVFLGPGMIGWIDGKALHDAIGITLIAWAIFTAILTLTAVRINNIVATIFVSLLVLFILLIIGHYSGSTVITHIAGWEGIWTAGTAWYGMYKGIEAQFGR